VPVVPAAVAAEQFVWTAVDRGIAVKAASFLFHTGQAIHNPVTANTIKKYFSYKKFFRQKGFLFAPSFAPFKTQSWAAGK
jgi:hypothetical protein